MLDCHLMERPDIVLRSADEDAELVRRIRESSPDEATDAEGELCRRLGPRIRLYGLRHLRDEQAAADLVQQVLLIMIEGLREGKLRQADKLASFVLGTCRMVVLEIRRGGTRRAELLKQFRRETQPIAIFQPSLDLDHLTACLNRLSTRERSVIVMTFYDEQRGDEVARALDLSSENVRVIRHRALGRLRNCMEGVA